tara:strand:+ start:74 stop:451 length:378 start_codon:yes stop_codon:yes gene_type:complete
MITYGMNAAHYFKNLDNVRLAFCYDSEVHVTTQRRNVPICEVISGQAETHTWRKEKLTDAKPISILMESEFTCTGDMKQWARRIDSITCEKCKEAATHLLHMENAVVVSRSTRKDAFGNYRIVFG